MQSLFVQTALATVIATSSLLVGAETHPELVPITEWLSRLEETTQQRDTQITSLQTRLNQVGDVTKKVTDLRDGKMAIQCRLGLAWSDLDRPPEREVFVARAAGSQSPRLGISGVMDHNDGFWIRNRCP